MTGRTVMSIILLLFSPAVSFAAPVPPQYILNEATRECSLFYPGDECVACQAPEGWIPLSHGAKNQCPEGYREVKIKPVCYPQKNAFCCTRGHSGAPGNCEDLVINDKEKKCAFVDDIKSCSSLPEGWRRSGRGENCPFSDYGWLNRDFECKKAVKDDEKFPPGHGPFYNPTVDGYRLDWCRQWATDCGEGAANAFCRLKGFSQARSWEIDYDIGDRFPTRIIETGQICDQRFCDGFTFILCE